MKILQEIDPAGVKKRNKRSHRMKSISFQSMYMLVDGLKLASIYYRIIIISIIINN